ncbi:zincin-like metallopeptidase domain-containing protein [Chryseobacterium aquaticum]|uniref:DNA primase n=1 Tax=Chryseobacterium aquaticum subsp. greenlandense TaxID=345663 RepID=A0A101CHQ8_9FLAO|nr:zincin-like metallopeptidase domain-containing protein [Chryseobacterium aquaticum]KUJ56420.1 hypothetical protein AR686_07615 [Chryseobacterium aquaticum subsp. greenlandense]
MKTFSKKSNSTDSSKEKNEDKFILKILENLDKVNPQDWEHYADVQFQMPKNFFTKKQYQGFNTVALYIDALVNQFPTTDYATFKSISKAGGRLKKGAKGTIIEFFSFIYKHKETGKIYSKEQVLEMSVNERENINKISCLKNYTVFNSELIENKVDLKMDTIIEEEKQELDFRDQCNSEAFINSIITNGNLIVRHILSNTAYYKPASDIISMPEKKYFISENKYYSTLFHEIIHWTGHESRLKRDLKGHLDLKSYSFEELIAEMGSMLICLQFGITKEFINSVRYLKSWSVKNTTKREENIKKAFASSKKAKKFLEQL